MNNQPLNTEVSLEFRIKFKEEYGVDFLEAVIKLREDAKQSERDWISVLMKNKVI